MQFKKTALSVSLALCIPSVVSAAPPAPVHTFTGNVGVFSDYLFRGVTQTSNEMALQGGLDYAHASGFYVGTWGSNISWLSDTALYTRSSLELDVYGGYKGSFGGDFGYDVGAIYYYYPGKKLSGVNSADTLEVYGALSWKWLSAKLSYATTDYFGYVKSDGSYYVDLSASYPIGDTGVTLLGHVGFLKVEGNPGGVSNDSLFGYTDWKVGATYGLPQNFTIGAYYSDTDAEKASYTVNGDNWADSRVVAYIQKTF